MKENGRRPLSRKQPTANKVTPTEKVLLIPNEEEKPLDTLRRQKVFSRKLGIKNVYEYKSGAALVTLRSKPEQSRRNQLPFSRNNTSVQWSIIMMVVNFTNHQPYTAKRNWVPYKSTGRTHPPWEEPSSPLEYFFQQNRTVLSLTGSRRHWKAKALRFRGLRTRSKITMKIALALSF